MAIKRKRQKRIVPADKINKSLKAIVLKSTEDGKLFCSVAFEIALKYNFTPAEVGIHADALNIRLARCQLGLFGHTPQRKIVMTLPSVPSDLKTALDETQRHGSLTCKELWQISAKLNIEKMTVSNACETMGLKIRKCQLGAF